MEAISPLKTECQVVGIYTDEITPLFLSRETEISIGRKKMTIDKAQKLLEEAIRTLKKLDKKASVIKETSKRVVEGIREEERQSKRRSKKERDAKRMEKARSAKRVCLSDNPYLRLLSVQGDMLNDERSDVKKKINDIVTELEWKKERLERILNQDMEIEVDDVEEKMEEEELKSD